MTIARELPAATADEAFAIASLQRWALAMGSRSTVPAPATARAGEPAAAGPAPLAGDPQRAGRRAEALLRLAMDPAASAHERALAATRAADYLRASA